MLVRTEASAKHIAAQLAREGFITAFHQGGIEIRRRGQSEGERDEGFLVSARKVVVLYGETLKSTRQALTGLASKENGRYIGWQALDQSPLGSGVVT